METRPPASLNGADWGSSEAKHLMAQDMLDGLVPIDQPIADVRLEMGQRYDPPERGILDSP